MSGRSCESFVIGNKNEFWGVFARDFLNSKEKIYWGTFSKKNGKTQVEKDIFHFKVEVYES